MESRSSDGGGAKGRRVGGNEKVVIRMAGLKGAATGVAGMGRDGAAPKGRWRGGKARGGPSEEGGRPLIVRDQARREKVEERGYFSVGFWRFQVG